MRHTPTTESAYIQRIAQLLPRQVTDIRPLPALNLYSAYSGETEVKPVLVVSRTSHRAPPTTFKKSG